MESIQRHRNPVYSYDNLLRISTIEDIKEKLNNIHYKYAPKPIRLLEVKYDIKIKNKDNILYSMKYYNYLTKPLVKRIKLLALEDECNIN